tara:strand:+ start:11483 stop:11893 length:411 start_codon:yes stop_codon:yes gene_type:complete
MDIDPLLTVLKDALPKIKEFGGAEDLPDAQKSFRKVPAIFVVPSGKAGTTNSTNYGVIDQKITQRFSILAVFKNPSLGDLHETDQAIMDAVIGWSHPSIYKETKSEQAEFINQRTINLRGYLATSLDFQLTYHFRK